MEKKLKLFIEKYSEEESLLNRIVVSQFLRYNNIELNQECYLTKYLLHNIPAETISIQKLEDVIKIFELAIPENEKIENGAVYTPKYIREYIVDQVFSRAHGNNIKAVNQWLCADISCGCGAFLYTISKKIKDQAPKLTYREIFQNLYGIDIAAHSVERAKILLSLWALMNNEYTCNGDFNIFEGNSLSYDFSLLTNVHNNGGFDIIVGNPPYVRAKHMETNSKLLLGKWKTSNCGNPDLYVPFFEIGISNLQSKGILGYITLNTFFKAVNSRNLRNYFSNREQDLTIVNFGQNLVFEKKLAYTCLVFTDGNSNQGRIHYTKVSPEEICNNKTLSYSIIKYSQLDDHRGWNLNDDKILKNIRVIESTGKSLGDSYMIKNGIATLANDVYIFKPIKTDNNYYYFFQEGIYYQIEKEICRDIIKPNTLKSEEELTSKIEKIIFPYDKEYKVLDESFFKNTYPFAYQYLCSVKKKLNKRDKGIGKYPAWYAFGRNQAISDKGIRLLFPYMSDSPHFIYSSQEDLLMYCGYAIFHNSEKELLVLKRILESCVFDYYIKNTSKPYSTNYYAYAKNYVKNFGIYPFTEEEKEYLLSLKTKIEIDSFICLHYKIKLS